MDILKRNSIGFYNVINNTKLRKVYDTHYGPCKIIQYVDSLNILIEFTNTGFKRWTRMDKLVSGQVKDFRYKSVYGIGYLGDDFKEIKGLRIYDKAYNAWFAMIRRCYCDNDAFYESYGLIGVKVDKRWHSFSNFVNDLVNLPGYNEKDFINGKLELDKDKLQHSIPCSNKIYSRKTCCLLTSKENISHQDKIVKFICIYPNTNIDIQLNMSEFAKSNNLDISTIAKCIKGKRTGTKGYRFLPFNDTINLLEIR